MRRLAIYAHYDSQREVKRFTLHFLQCLAELCERVDFVSTSPLPERELDKVRPLCARAFTKENTGFDFGMWQRALGDVDLAAWDELVITNSSVFGPLFPLEEMFERMAATRCDFWSATDNHDIDWHLQSYFVVFRRRALSSPAFAAFWASVLPYTNKYQVIRSYEVGLTQHLIQYGLEGQAYVPAASLFPPWPLSLRYPKRRLDATVFYPTLLMQRRMPFLKASLLRENPGKLNLKPIYRAVEACGYDRSLIEFDDRRPKPRLDALLETIRRRP